MDSFPHYVHWLFMTLDPLSGRWHVYKQTSANVLDEDGARKEAVRIARRRSSPVTVLAGDQNSIMVAYRYDKNGDSW